MKLAYVGLDLFYPALEALVDLGCQVMELFTCPVDNEFEFNTRLVTFAEERGIPCHSQPIKPEDIQRLKERGCQLIVSAAYYYKIPTEHDVPMVNIHPALLPIGRGAWPGPVTILKGLQRSGVTFHKLTAEFDVGDIILQQGVDVAADENLETLTEKQCRLLPGMIRELTADFDRLYAAARPQGQGEYWKNPQNTDRTIDSTMLPRQIDLILRAFYGFECFVNTPQGSWAVLRGQYVPNGIAGENAIAVNGGTIQAQKMRPLT